MEKELIELNDLRQKEESLKAYWQQKLDKLAKENEGMIGRIREYTEKINIVETKIKTAALEKYKETGEKKLEFGVGIQTRQIYLFDNDAALAWAAKTGLCLKLDLTAFKKIAKVQKLNFVTIDEEDIATIPGEIKIE